MKENIRKILREQITADDFCLPVKGWKGLPLSANQLFGACRNKKVKQLEKDTCKKCEKCKKGDKCIKCKCCRIHKGADIVVNSGTELYAPAGGTIVKSHITSDGCGGFIRIDHGNGIETKYCHLREREVKKDEEVVKGQLLGLTGGDSGDVGNGNSSNAHLHYEVLKNGKAINPVTHGYLDGGPCDVQDVIVVDDKTDEEESERVNPKAVRAQQKLLYLAGYLDENTFIPGELDEITIEAIKEVQETHELTVTGIMDRDTYFALKKDAYGPSE